MFKGSQEQSFFLQALLFTAFLVPVLKILTYALVHMILGQLRMRARQTKNAPLAGRTSNSPQDYEDEEGEECHAKGLRVEN